jgi:hypothetical protein
MSIETFTSYNNNLDNLIAGDFDIVTDEVTVVSGAGVLARGTVLGKITASGKYKIVNSANVDGSQTPVCVLAQAVDATAADVVTSVYLTGEYSSNALVFGGTDTATTHKAALRLLNIFIKSTVAA